MEMEWELRKAAQVLVDQMLNVKPIDAWMYHYGWVKDPRAMQKKQEDFNKLWHDDEWIDKNVAKADEFDYTQVDSLKLFEGTHPEVMKARIEAKNWKFDYDISFNKKSLKDRFKIMVKKLFGYEIAYKNYKIIK